MGGGRVDTTVIDSPYEMKALLAGHLDNLDKLVAARRLRVTDCHAAGVCSAPVVARRDASAQLHHSLCEAATGLLGLQDSLQGHDNDVFRGRGSPSGPTCRRRSQGRTGRRCSH